MINFNEVYYKTVQKEDVAWTQSLSTMLFDLERYEFEDVKIPLSPTIFKRIWPDTIRSKAFHLTDFAGVHKLKKMQGGKKSISAFYNIEDHILNGGIRTQGGYVVEIEGDVLAAAPDDIASQPDKTGRRWLVWSTIKDPINNNGMGGGSKIQKMEKDLENLLIQLIQKHDKSPIEAYRQIPATAWEDLGRKTGGKAKSLIIKDYIDGMEKIMKKYSRPLKSIFTDYTKKRTLDPDEDSGDTAMWDELVISNFKIQKIHVAGGYLGPDYHDDEVRDRHSKILSTLGFPFELYEDVGDLVDYITRTIQNIKL